MGRRVGKPLSQTRSQDPRKQRKESKSLHSCSHDFPRQELQALLSGGRLGPWTTLIAWDTDSKAGAWKRCKPPVIPQTAAFLSRSCHATLSIRSGKKECSWVSGMNSGYRSDPFLRGLIFSSLRWGQTPLQLCCSLVKEI